MEKLKIEIVIDCGDNYCLGCKFQQYMSGVDKHECLIFNEYLRTDKKLDNIRLTQCKISQKYLPGHNPESAKGQGRKAKLRFKQKTSVEKGKESHHG